MAKIPAANVEGLRDKLAKLMKRAERKGLSGFAVVWGELYTEVEAIRQPNGTTVNVRHEYRDVEVTGEPPSLGGWQLAAVVEMLAGAPVHMLRVVPGFPHQIPERFRTGDPCACDHCHAYRQRSETFVVWHAERDEYKQVGRQCIRDFLGHDPATMLMWASILPSLSEAVEEFAGDGDFRSNPSYEVSYLLDLAARVVAVDGWKSRSADPERCTAATICHYLCLRNNAQDQSERERFEATYATTDRAASLLARTMARVEELKAKALPDLRGDYETNLWAVVHAGWCEFKHVGLVASMLAYAVKQENDEAARRGLPSVAESKHVGNVGDRLRGVSATVAFTKTFEGMYGAKTLVKFTTNDGNSLTWWASGVPDMRAGDAVTLTGTVKAHETDKYTNAATTVLLRCKVDRVVLAAA